MPAANRPRKASSAPIAQSFAPAPVPGLSDAVAVAIGGAHACALKKGGTVACWGENGTGELGDGTTEPRREPAQAQGVRDAIQIAAYLSASCALLRGGSVVCWGAAGGTAEDAQQASPGAAVFQGVAEISGACARGTDGAVRCRRGELVSAVEGANAARITFGVAHGCLLTPAGEARCWGANRSGELGDGTHADHRRPTPVAW
jgi:alpha-tubulin suppressor-like RCC1 family protein